MANNVPKKNELQCDVCYRIRHMSQIENHLLDVSAAVDIEPAFLGISINYCIKSKTCYLGAQKMAEKFNQWIEKRHKEVPCKISQRS